MATDELAIKVENVTKTFRLPHEKHTSLKGALISKLKGGKNTYEKQRVLNDISFEIQKGDFFGIVGRNGSGKSTLLKLLAGIYTPDQGNITVRGKLTPFIELGVGFNPELTGRENVFLNGALLGFNRAEMEALYVDIVAFAELEKFMDQKLKNYSSGMQVRLAFSIAIRTQTDVLLLDEVLAVGDEAFQRKCYDYFEDLKRNKKTVILVTHDMSAVEKFCNRAILIESGEIIKEGNPKIVALGYTKLFNLDSLATNKAAPEIASEAPTRWGSHDLKIGKIGVVHDESNPPLRSSIKLSVECNTPVSTPVQIAYTVKSKDGTSLFGDGFKTLDFKGLSKGEVAECTISFVNFLSHGEYYLDVSLRKAGDKQYLDFWVDAHKFLVKNGKKNDLHILTDSKFTIA